MMREDGATAAVMDPEFDMMNAGHNKKADLKRVQADIDARKLK